MREFNELIGDLASTYLRLERDGDIEFPDLIPVTLAQWMLESGHGTSELATRYHNFAGLKWRPEMAAGQGRDERGAATPVTYDAHDGRDEYCRFSDPENFIFGYWRFIHRSPYRGFEQFGSDPEGYIQFLKDHHYAEDPRYVTKVLSLAPDAQALLDAVGGSTRSESVDDVERGFPPVGRRRDRRSRRPAAHRDAVYLHTGGAGLVEEWEADELMADAETGGDVDRLLDFLDRTEVAEYSLVQGEDVGRDEPSARSTRRSRRSGRSRSSRRRADGIYIDDSAQGRVEEWEGGQLVADAETDGDLDRLLDFLDQTRVQDYFIEVSRRRTRSTVRPGPRDRVRERDDEDRHEPPLVRMDDDDEDDRRPGELDGLSVALDVGHGITAKGVKDPGAVNKTAGIKEHDLNRLVAQTAAEVLRERGATVDVFLYDNPSERLTLRQKGQRAKGHDVFISCHHNAASNSSAQRTETLLGERHNTAEDKRLATAVQSALVSTLNLKDGGVRTRPLGVLTGAGALVKAKCLIEPYFISERSMTKTKAEGLSRDAGAALALGIGDYWLRN